MMHSDTPRRAERAVSLTLHDDALHDDALEIGSRHDGGGGGQKRADSAAPYDALVAMYASRT